MPIGQVKTKKQKWCNKMIKTRTYIWLILCEEERERLWKTRWWTLLLPTLRYRVLTLFQMWPKHLDLEIIWFVIFSPSRLFGPHLNLQFCVGGMLGWEQTNEIDLTFVNKRVNGTKPLHRRLFVYNYKADIGFITDQTDMLFVFWANVEKKNIKSQK